jgi:phosphate starvation-inducible PhoH-like protein
MTFHELDSIITRVGKNCRIIFCGDFFQSDLKNSGLKDFIEIIKDMYEFDFIEFGISDIVRSDFVRSYLTEKYTKGII